MSGAFTIGGLAGIATPIVVACVFLLALRRKT